MKKKTFRLLPSCALLLSLLGSSVTFAQEVTFDSGFLKLGKSQVIDVTRFSREDAFLAGTYDADIFVNDQYKGRKEIRFIEQNKKMLLCLSSDLKHMLDLKQEAYSISGVSSLDHSCYTVDVAIPQAKVKFNANLLRLDVEIAQALTIHRPRGYIAPSRWQTGTTAAFANYDLNHFRYSNGENNAQQTYLSLRTGLNYKEWSLRHFGTKSWYADSKGLTTRASEYQIGDTYIQRPLESLQALLTVGDFHAGGSVMSGFGVRGVRVASDDRMLASSQRGYAPVIQGYAATNAQVVVRQAGHIVYQMTVPSGLFVINDLYSTGYSGDLEVEITESTGEKKKFTVPFAHLIQLVRPGYLRYEITGGLYRYGNKVLNKKVIQGTAQYGLRNNLSLNAGVTATHNYLSGLLGFAVNTPIGAFNADVTLSKTRFLNSGSILNGYSLHGSYNTIIPVTDTRLVLAAYRYSSPHYYTMQDAISANSSDYIDEKIMHNRHFSTRIKHRLQISANQKINDKWGSFYLIGSTYNYWNKEGTTTEYQFSYNNRFNQISSNVGITQTKDNTTHEQDTSYFLNLSLPLGKERHSPNISTSYQHSEDTHAVNTTLSGSLGEYSQFNYGITQSSNNYDDHGLATNMSYRIPYAQIHASYSMDNHHNRQVSAGISGAVVAHKHGVTLSNTVGESFAILHAKGAKGATVSSEAFGQKIDRFGNAIMTHLSPYQINHVGLDPNNLPLNVELESTHKEVIPKANGIHIVEFDAKVNTMVLFNIKMPEGVNLPMGAEAFDEQGNIIGYVVQGGTLFASQLKATQGKVRVKWSERPQDNCSFDYDIRQHQGLADEMQEYQVSCTVQPSSL